MKQTGKSAALQPAERRAKQDQQSTQQRDPSRGFRNKRSESGRVRIGHGSSSGQHGQYIYRLPVPARVRLAAPPSLSSPIVACPESPACTGAVATPVSKAMSPGLFGIPLVQGAPPNQYVATGVTVQVDSIADALIGRPRRATSPIARSRALRIGLQCIGSSALKNCGWVAVPTGTANPALQGIQ
jgi:hypothetical protein